MTTEQHLRPFGLLLGPLVLAIAGPACGQAKTPAPKNAVTNSTAKPQGKRVRGPGYFVQLPLTKALRAYATRVAKGVDYTERKVEHRSYPRQVLPDDGLAGIPEGYPETFKAESIYVGFKGFAIERLKFESRQSALDWAATVSLGTRGGGVWRVIEVRGRHVVHVVGGKALNTLKTILAARDQGWSGFKVQGEPDLVRVAHGEALAIGARNDGGLLRLALNDVMLAVQETYRSGERDLEVGDSPIVGAKTIRILDVHRDGHTIKAQVSPVKVMLQIQRDDQLQRARIGRPADLKSVMKVFKTLAPKGLRRKVAFPKPSNKRIPRPPTLPASASAKAISDCTCGRVH